MIRRVLPKITMTRARRTLLAVLLALGGAMGVYYGYLSNSGEVVQIFDGELLGPAMVIAPHSDDEVLGAGGVIQRHLAQGDRVVVVLFTNGDGQYRGLFHKRAQAIQFGYLRQEESRKALRQLGVPEENVIFLGYPDRGLAQLWNHYWDCDRLYTSSQTGANRSPYANSFTPGAPYCGLSVVRDLEALLKREKPKTIYLPHPNDLHADHWSAHAFTLYALEQLKRQHPPDETLRGAQLWAYLVHYGRWPMPRGKFLKAKLSLPRSLHYTDTRWWSIPLTPDETLRKYRAIREYKSQVQYMPLYLISFARANELFGSVPTLKLFDDGSSQPEFWLSYPDPREHTLLGGIRGENDIRMVRLAKTPDDALVIEVEFFNPLRSTSAVFLHIKTIGGDGALPSTWRFVRSQGRLYLNGELLRDLRIAHDIHQRTFWLRLPLERLGDPPAIMLGAELLRGGMTISKSAYRLIELSPAPSLVRSP